MWSDETCEIHGHPAGFRPELDNGIDWQVQPHPTQPQQTLMNLCINARDAMPRGGRIGIAAENMTLDDHYAAMNIESVVGPAQALRGADLHPRLRPVSQGLNRDLCFEPADWVENIRSTSRQGARSLSAFCEM